MKKTGIYLIVEFNWPGEVTREQANLARALHQIVQERGWIKEIVAASGGLGSGPSSIWIFWLKDYATLDRLLRTEGDEVGQAYRSFFQQMPLVKEKIREEVEFL